LSFILRDKEKLKEYLKSILSGIIEKPNKDVLSVRAYYDPNLDVVTLSYYSLKEDREIIVFDERAGESHGR